MSPGLAGLLGRHPRRLGGMAVGGLVVVAAVAAARLPPEYAAVGSAVVVARPSDAAGDPAILAERVEDRDVRAQLAGEGATGDYDVVVDAAGIVQVTAWGEREEVAVRTARAVVAELGVLMAAEVRDSDLPEALRPTLEVLNLPNRGWAAEPVAAGAFEAMGAGHVVDPVAVADASTTISFFALRMMLADYLVSEDVRTHLLGTAPAMDYMVTASKVAPTIDIVASGEDPAAVVAIVDAVAAEAARGLDRLATVASAGDLSGVVVVPYLIPGHAPVQRLGLIRPLAGLALVAVLLAIATAVAVERLALVRVGPAPANRSSTDASGARGV